ncbi:MAG: glutamyl-tRNA reductase [Thermoleophilaceae bacterium]
MSRGLVVAGVSQRTNSVETRERLALDRAQAGALASSIAARPEIDEALVLSTCERTELYALAGDTELASAVLREQLDELAGPLEAEPLELSGQRAAVHLMRVAAGLESVVLGETEILGQVRRAGELARERRASAYVLGHLVQAALVAGRRVREETEIARGRASLGSAAVDLARQLARSRDAARALVLGSGETGAQVARALRSEGFALSIAARHSSDRAIRLAQEVGASLVDLEGQLFEALVEADVVISCTGAPHRLVASETLIDVIERRAGRELVVLDLAMPRDFDPRAKAVRRVRLYDLDDLREVVGETALRRSWARPAAEAIVAEEAERFRRWFSALGAVPTIKDLRSHSRKTVLDALKASGLADGADEQLLHAASDAIVARLLHTPTIRLRAAAELGDADGLMPSVRALFALDVPGR